MELIKRFIVEEEGADATEYALMLGLIALVIIAAVAGLGKNIKNMFNNVSTSIGNNTPGATANSL